MKSNCYSPSTTVEQGELFACPFQNAQKSAKTHIETEVKHKKIPPNTHQYLRVIPFGVIEETLTISVQNQRVNEANFYHSGKEIARWLVKKSEYNKREFTVFPVPIRKDAFHS
ncbi:hypothetical protein [Lysinibacillus sp. NPDC056232]|uniref:hypothetical protein n=1 Tax=Lysinibacillus sp. NPDC056232 TaxID=3345756 RepID=UPI0035DF5A79